MFVDIVLRKKFVFLFSVVGCFFFHSKKQKHNKKKYLKTKKDEDTEIGIIHNLQVLRRFFLENMLCFFVRFFVFKKIKKKLRYCVEKKLFFFCLYTFLDVRERLVKKDLFNSWNNIGEKTFLQISTIEEIYKYMEEILLPALLVETDANGNYINNSDQRYYMTGQMRLLGGIRLRQS